jgi:hypothetical protein
MADTKRQQQQQGNEMIQEEQRNAPGSDRTSPRNQQTSQGGAREGIQDARNQGGNIQPDENPEPGRRR